MATPISIPNLTPEQKQQLDAIHKEFTTALNEAERAYFACVEKLRNEYQNAIYTLGDKVKDEAQS